MAGVRDGLIAGFDEALALADCLGNEFTPAIR